jgi:hypothetical protein
MHLLIRRISPYTGPDLLLGAFSTAYEAAAAKSEYTKKYASDPNADPWRDQAYKQQGLSERDLIIREVPSAVIADEVFGVSNYFDRLGMIDRHFDSIHVSADSAAARKAELDAAEDQITHYALIQGIQVGVPLSDGPEEQPGVCGDA